MLTVAITGHRPEKIDDPGWVVEQLNAALTRFDTTLMIQGMASGVDLWSAKVAFALGIPYICARPWRGHQPRRADEYDYHAAAKHAQEVVDVVEQDEFPGNWVYMVRNKWMIDRADMVVSVWDGEPKGGTFNAVEHAKKRGLSVYNLNPRKRSVDFLVESV